MKLPFDDYQDNLLYFIKDFEFYKAKSLFENLTAEEKKNFNIFFTSTFNYATLEEEKNSHEIFRIIFEDFPLDINEEKFNASIITALT